MFARLGSFVVRRRWVVLATTLGFVVLAGILGSGVFGRLSIAGFDDPNSEAAEAEALLEERFDTGHANVAMIVRAENGDVDSPAATEAGTALTRRLAGFEGMDDVASYWTLGNAPPLRSEDGSAALLVGRLRGEADQWKDEIDAVVESFDGDHGAVTVQVGGMAAGFRNVGDAIERDLQRSESVAVPVTLVLLVVIFGGLIAAALPLAVGGVAIVGAFLVLMLVTQFTDVSVYSINLVTGMGLGLAVDYSLLVVSRYREELDRGRSVEDAVVRTVQTAGRTVAFSALIVAASLSALLIFPLFFLRSFAYAGIGVIVVGSTMAVVALPALLAVVGTRIDKLRLWRKPARPATPGEGFWHRLAVLVMRRPVPFALGVTAALVVLGLPFLRVTFGVPDDRVLPDDDPVREMAEDYRSEFDAREADALGVVAVGADRHGPVHRYAEAVSGLDGVARVDTATGHYVDGTRVLGPNPATERFTSTDGADTWFSVVPSVEPISPEGEALVADLRALDAPFDTAVGGNAADFVDGKEAVFSQVPWAAAIIVVTSFVLLFLLMGSLLVPVKAIVINTLSLTATFGAMVWVFQDGNGSGLLDFTATGLTDLTTPILMFCIAFGLSMDYEVFLLSRIKEEHDRIGDNDAAVALGLERTGRIVTAAALVLAVTFISFATSDITFIKLFGVGLAVAVLMDATIVRALLVPALMKLAGNANWWAPKPLRWLHDRVGLRESGDIVTEPPVDAGPEPAGPTGYAAAQELMSRYR